MVFYTHLEVRRMPVGHQYALRQSLGKVFVNNSLATTFVNCHINQCIGLKSSYPMLLTVYFDTCLIRPYHFRFFYSGAYGIHFAVCLLTHALKYI